MNAWEMLQSVKTKLAEVDGVTTCRIGIETGLSPDDYPMIRIVPERFSQPDIRTLSVTLTVYYGLPLAEADDDLEAVYEALITMETDIKTALRTGEGYYPKFVDTVTDEDRLEQYKLFASRYEITIQGDR